MSGGIAIVGDFDAARPTNAATENALRHAAGALGVELASEWLATAEILELPPRRLEAFDGFFVAPGSPYRSLDGALRAIRLARETGKPLLGTCGGFQHVVLEFARNVVGLEGAQHAEYEPGAGALVIQPLACSLAGRREAVRLEPGSQVAALYGAEVVSEEYRCSFGVAPEYAPGLERSGLVFSGRDVEGEPRVVELPKHPFHLATLFVPQLSSHPEHPHPLFVAFVAAVHGARATRLGRRASAP